MRQHPGFCRVHVSSCILFLPIGAVRGFDLTPSSVVWWLAGSPSQSATPPVSENIHTTIGRTIHNPSLFVEHGFLPYPPHMRCPSVPCRDSPETRLVPTILKIAGSTPVSASFFLGTEAAKSVSLTSLQRDT